MKSSIALNGLRRTLRRKVLDATGRAAQLASARQRRAGIRVGGPRSLSGYSTVAGGSAGGSFIEVERAVERVLDDVLRTSTQQGSQNVNGGTAATANGRSLGGGLAVAPYASAARQPDLRTATRTLAGLDGRISPHQAILRSLATPVLHDIVEAAEVLAGAADDYADEARSLARLIADQVAGIKGEIEGPEPPRDRRVTGFIDAIGTTPTSGLIGELSEAAEIDLAMDIVSPEDESLVAALTLLVTDAQQFDRYWSEYLIAVAPGTVDSLGERLAQASRLFPVIADATATLTGELSRAGFTRREAASASGDLETIDTIPPRILPDISFDRLLDWLETWAADDGPRAVSEGSRHGLDRATDEADSLFFVVEGVHLNVIDLTAAGTASAPRLATVLAGRRVQPILDQLARHLNSMASLA